MYVTDPITLSRPMLPNSWQEAVQFRVDGTFAEQPPISPAQRRIDICLRRFDHGWQSDQRHQAARPTGPGRMVAFCAMISAGTARALPSAARGSTRTAAITTRRWTSLIGLRALPADFTTTLTAADYAAGQKSRVLRHFIREIIILPRQARDKHREPQTRDALSHSWAAGRHPDQPGDERLGKGRSLRARTRADSSRSTMRLPFYNAAAVGIRAFKIAMTTPVDRCGHPPYASHEMMASQARPIIARALGWDSVENLNERMGDIESGRRHSGGAAGSGSRRCAGGQDQPVALMKLNSTRS
jgi:hypothetical protein